MPNAVIKSYAEKTSNSVEHVEAWWDEAKEQAGKKFKKKDKRFWAYVNGIVKRRAGLSEETTFKEFSQLLRLIEASERKLGYHGTLTSNVDKIKKEGLRSGDDTVVYLANTKDAALNWARALHGPNAKVSVLTIKHDRDTSGPVIQIHDDVPPADIVNIENF